MISEVNRNGAGARFGISGVEPAGSVIIACWFSVRTLK
jgi:hypothetical protein